MSRIMMQRGDVTQPLCFGNRTDRAPLACSSPTAWSGTPFEVHQLESVADVGESGPVPGELGLMIVTHGEYETTLRGRSADVRRRSRPGSITLLSGDDRPYVHEIVGAAEIIAIPVTEHWLDYVPVDGGDLRPGYGDGGEPLQALISAMRHEVATGCGAGRLYAESLSIALLSYALHVLPRQDRTSGCASLSSDEQQRIICYVHDHLDGDLGLATLATLLGMRVRDFSGRFRRAFGTSAHRYVMRARLREGERLLAAGRHEIAEIALRIGFSSQSHFTTAFSAAYGQTPKRYARAPGPWRRRRVPAAH